ncbi:MAG: hypothetical protein CVU87_11625 [Firmicutes bacterium HGW-Firmicutes-12]|nr:MAG: hypothetical protein CVU87_11625 [Firmicutes bacterium HGW-Firmicutes-12]
MKKQRAIIIMLGLVIALGSAYGMYTLAGELEKKTPVVIATSDIKSYEKYGPNNIQLVNMPVKYVLPNAITSINILAGKRAKGNIYQGEQIIQERIEEVKLKPSVNERLLFIPTSDVVMKPGQKVDIYLIFIPGKSTYDGAERLFADKTVATVISDTGQSIYEKNDTIRNQSGIEILLTHEEIVVYLERMQYSKDVIVRHGEGGER